MTSNDKIRDWAESNYKDMLKSATRRVGKQAAEDVVQQTFLYMCEEFSTSAGEDFSKWVSCRLNRAIKAKQRELRLEGMVMGKESEYEEDSYCGLDVKEGVVSQAYLEEFSKQNEKWQKVLSLYVDKDYSKKEIANIMSIKESAVSYIINKFRDKVDWNIAHEVLSN